LGLLTVTITKFITDHPLRRMRSSAFFLSSYQVIPRQRPGETTEASRCSDGEKGESYRQKTLQGVDAVEIRRILSSSVIVICHFVLCHQLTIP